MLGYSETKVTKTNAKGLKKELILLQAFNAKTIKGYKPRTQKQIESMSKKELAEALTKDYNADPNAWVKFYFNI